MVEALADRELTRRIVADGARLVDEEVDAKKGLTGIALRTGYKTIKALRPDMIEMAFADLLPDFAPILDPWWEKAKASGDTRGFFRRNASAIADDLLSVTDRRAERARNRVMLKVYQSLRGQAKKHTEESVPRIPDLIEKYDR